MIVVLATIQLVTFHMVDGRVIQINPDQVTQLIHPREGANRKIVDTVKCVVRLTDGSYVSLAETCEEVQAAIGEAR